MMRHITVGEFIAIASFPRLLMYMAAIAVGELHRSYLNARFVDDMDRVLYAGACSCPRPMWALRAGHERSCWAGMRPGGRQ